MQGRRRTRGGRCDAKLLVGHLRAGVGVDVMMTRKKDNKQIKKKKSRMKETGCEKDKCMEMAKSRLRDRMALSL